MTPIHLTMQAFGPYQEITEISFSELQGKLFLITGATGGGKTTILDAICFALFCRATGGRRTWQDMRNLSAGEDVPTVVDFTFSLGGEEYRFQRSWRWHKVRGSGRLEMRDEHQCSRKNAGEWELVVSGAEARVREYAQNLLGLTCEQFSQVIVLPQGEFRKLLLSNSTEKTKIFQTLFQTEKWEQITKCAQRLADDLGRQCGQLLSARQSILENENVQTVEELAALNRETAAEYEKSVAEAKKIENELSKITFIIQKVNKLLESQENLSKLRAQRKEAAAQKTVLEQKRREALEQEGKIAKLEEDRTAALKAVTQQREQLETLSKLQGLEKEKALLETEKAALEKEQRNWEQKALTAAENLEKGKAYLRDLNEKLKALPEAAQKAQELKASFDLLTQFEQEQEKLESEQKALTVSREAFERAKVNLSALQESLDKAQQAARNDMAGHLASGLREGEPCPVCGAAHHPRPAKAGEKAVTPEEEKRLKRLVKEAQGAFEKAQGEYTKRQGRAELLAKTAKEAQCKLEACGVPLKELPALLKAAQKELAALQEARERLPLAEKRLAQREEEQKTAREQAEQSKEKQARWENKLSAFRAGWNSLWETLPKDRQGQSLAAAEKSLRDYLAVEQARSEKLQREIQEIREGAAKAGEALAAASAREQALKAQEKEAAAQWEKAKAEAPGEFDREALEQALSELQAANREGLRKTGSLLQKKQSLEKEAAKIRELEDVGKEIQEEYAKAERIARFFSGKNPQNVPLKMFVLGVMLDDILSRANVYFTTLSSGRYQLNRKQEGASRGYSGLELEIYDAYSGGGRNVDTLSGGELFLASLSLAFGLSDVVQSYSGGVRLESIFIDEGFGTLDDETLNTAMKALFEIQKGGRTVGIISHVTELKSRIPAQIQITDGHKIKVVLP